ncbi:FAD-dependent oxidoreductase [Bacillus sp. FJAT-27245]|uniref:FAD-dependent oxidoreductase n=1 Tax=Bacillus sp. FJAT-27245 TaxID=1684144 RepID=UPI0006A7C57E|nr:FAD-dependent oxidoreductase [Bacillus sp. FJAT-27245]
MKNRALIIGGGIAGKLAARVLSEHFIEVVIIEKDKEAAGPGTRKGVPQGSHLHALLHAGEQGLESLFPGITESFYSGGALKINSTKDLAWFHHGVWKLRYDGGYTTTLQTRFHLEWQIENYIKSIPNISFLYKHFVKNFVWDEKQNKVIGLEMKDSDGNPWTLLADIVVDASGAGSFTAAWLEKLGISIPVETADIGLCYVSKFFRLPDHPDMDWAIKLIYPNPPAEKIGGALSKVEGNRYITTLFGYQNAFNEKEAAASNEAFLELAKKLPKPDIHNELLAGEPLGETAVYRIPRMTWRRYDKTNNLPEGLLLIGDAVCRIDPVFGQGMSIAVLEALRLQEIMWNKTLPLSKGIRDYHRKAAEIISPIWTMVMAENLRYPGISDKIPFGLSFQQWFTKQIFLLSAKDEKIYDSFIKVMNLVEPAAILLKPGILGSVFLNNRGNRKKLD